MIVLGLDTCLAACSVAVIDGARVLAHRSEAMARGHQERLAPMAQAVMADAGLGFDELERVGVTIGPGSFTGLRVGVAFAKGLSAALGVPLIGVGVLEALAAEVGDGLVFAAVDARRDQLYLQGFDGGRSIMAPDALEIGTAAARVAELAAGRTPVLVAALAAAAQVLTPEGADARCVARLAAARAPAPVRPLYLRAPDARLPA
jgi:tRNA threonylcarbamoyladenosine biosynthesis protein TsaB